MPPTAEKTPTSNADGASDPGKAEKRPNAAAPRADAESIGKQQREISVSEFFSKTRHLLGFDSPKKALLTTVKEAVDNSLDACEEAHILPDITVTITAVSKDGGPPPPPAKAERFTVSVRDNGPGIVKEQIPRIFAKLLYGSKFHRLRQSRGQQGIGISAAGMYGQLTTMKPLHVISKTGPSAKANSLDILIDTRKNEPIVVKKSELDWPYERGTEVTIELEGRYQRGRASVEEYVELTTIANPHVRLTYVPPEGLSLKVVYERGIAELPREPKEIRPHPYGIELGILHKMLQDTKSHWVSGFLSTDFSRVSPKLAADICEKAGLDPRMAPRKVVGQHAEKLYKAIQDTRLMAPPTDCLSPIGEEAILAGLYKQIRGDFYTAVTRPPAVYRGNPFVIEAGLAFGTGKAALAQPAESALEAETVLVAEGETKPGEEEAELARLMRYANRVPLLYQSSACATHKSVIETAWKNYGVGQSRGALPQGPLVIFVHMASAWVPFTSESKEAIADYDEIRKEIKLALQEAGRRLGVYIRKREHAKLEFRRRNVFELYIEEVAEACHRLKKGKFDVDRLKKQLQRIAEEKTGGEETDRLLQKKKEQEKELPNSIVVTPEGPIGAPEMALLATGHAPAPAPAAASESVSSGEPEAPKPIEAKPHSRKKTSPPKGRKKPPRRDDGNEKGSR
jgi:DNA topoisomerase-6 subunit B